MKADTSSDAASPSVSQTSSSTSSTTATTSTTQNSSEFDRAIINGTKTADLDRFVQLYNCCFVNYVFSSEIRIL